MNIVIDDEIQMLKFACDDLKALRTVVQVVEDQKDWPNEREMLTVTIRALTPIISDIQVAVDGINDALRKEKDSE